jgi:quinol monooxygenase YgiN
MIIMATVANQVVAIGAAGLAGLSWIAVLSSLNVSAQTALPDWVRARGLSVFLTIFFGSMSLGSLAWGQVASVWGTPVALIAAAVGALALIPLTRRAKLLQGAALDLTPSMHWPEPVKVAEETPDGPVMIQIDYRVAKADRARFLDLMTQMAASRRRGGGYRWTVMADAADETRYVETWWEASWLDHLRQHQRVSNSDRAIQSDVAELQIDGRPPEVSHFVGPSLPS